MIDNAIIFTEESLKKHDTDLLDKVAEKFHGRIRLRELTRQETMDIFDDIIVEMKAEVEVI